MSLASETAAVAASVTARSVRARRRGGVIGILRKSGSERERLSSVTSIVRTQRGHDKEAKRRFLAGRQHGAPAAAGTGAVVGRLLQRGLAAQQAMAFEQRAHHVAGDAQLARGAHLVAPGVLERRMHE